MSNCDGDKVVHLPESGSFLHPRNLIDLEARANGVKHFGHDHALTFKEDVRNGLQGKDLCCINVCGIETGSCGFSCNMENCKFLLHEFCAFLPGEMKDHPKHPEHSLILKSHAITNYYSKSNCNVCDDRYRHYPFCYECVDCYYTVDLGCASMSIFVYNNNIHNHLLTAQLYPSSFLCHCCGENHTELGMSYQCRTCSFWLHEECSSLSPRIKHDSHVCQLSLMNFKWSNYSPKGTCGVCNKNIDPTSNFYCCEKCYYFVHIKCSAEKWDPEIEKVEQDQIKDRFPLSSAESVQKRLAQFIQNKCEWKDTAEDKNGDVLNHPSHHHPLTLEFDSSKFINSEDIAKRCAYEVCNACILPLLDAPHYSCTQSSCNFVLHQWCAKLPHELKHPAHIDPEHTLILHEKLDKCFGFFRCNGCKEIGNGFAYKCNECEEYCLDLRCATLPSLVYYGTDHTHHLRLKHRIMSGGCISCNMINFHKCRMPICDYNLLSTDNSGCSTPFLFGCDACHYNICINCVTLPEKVLHWYDQHEFKLTHLDDVPTHDDDNTNLCYHCEFCEDELNTNKWIYHCAECDQCVDAVCVRHVFGLLPSPIKFGESYDSPYHKELGHKLICFGITEELGDCERCKKYCFRFGIGFKCKECEIVLSLECAYSKLEGFSKGASKVKKTIFSDYRAMYRLRLCSCSISVVPNVVARHHIANQPLDLVVEEEVVDYK